MQFRTAWRGVALALAPLVLIGFVAACGGGDDDDRAPAKATGAATSVVTNTPTIVMTDNKFTPAAFTVAAGQPVKLTAENKGAAIHNWKVLGVKGADGKEITTTLLPGGQTDNITFTIDKAGTYDVHCDVHPADMRGKLTVQ